MEQDTSAEKSFEGSLARVEVPDVFTFVNMGRRTGVLAMTRRQEEIHIYFQQGEPIFAGSNREDLRLSSMLVRAGKLAAQDVERVVAEHHSPGDRIGQAFIRAGVIQPEELIAFLRVQVSEVIFETFDWHEGRFAFCEGVTPPSDAVTLELSLQNLVMEGVRRIDERGRVSELFPDLDMVVELVANTDRVKQRLTLTPEEWRILFLANGRRTLAELCRLAGNPDEAATLHIVRRLHSANVVNVLQASEEPLAEVAAAPEAEGGTFLSRPPGSSPASVEFSDELALPRPGRDASSIVSPKAVQYAARAARPMLIRLVLVRDGGEVDFALTRDSYTMGRNRNNDVLIGDPAVSGFHARIDRTADGFTIVDLGSRNGTFVNGQRVESWALEGGDEIRVGGARLLYKVV